MDRNSVAYILSIVRYVALRKESVDRNILFCKFESADSSVALRKESVDRNDTYTIALRIAVESLSARRAWIEISYSAAAQSVQGSRSPQGERG